MTVIERLGFRECPNDGQIFPLKRGPGRPKVFCSEKCKAAFHYRQRKACEALGKTSKREDKSMALFSKRHYNWLAQFVNEYPTDFSHKNCLAICLATALAEDNDKFDEGKFIARATR